MQCHSLDIAVGFYCTFMAILDTICWDPCWDLQYQGRVTKKFKSISLPAARGWWGLSLVLSFSQCLVKGWAPDLSDTQISVKTVPRIYDCWDCVAQPAMEKAEAAWADVLMPTGPGYRAPCPHHMCHVPQAPAVLHGLVFQCGASVPKGTCQTHFQWASPLPCPTTPSAGREALGGMLV